MQLGINLRREMLGHVVVVFGKIRIVLYSLILDIFHGYIREHTLMASTNSYLHRSIMLVIT